jgi:hypothetical protein
MSKNNFKYNNFDNLLPKHQKKIMLCLAENKPMTMSEANRKLNGENTSTTRAFHELERKRMITETEKQEYRGRKFSKYWLSESGVAFALMWGANPSKTERIALTLSRGKIYFDLHSISPKIANIIDWALIFNDGLNLEKLIQRCLLESVLMEKSERAKLLKIIKESGKFEDIIKSTIEEIKKVTAEIEKTLE